MYQRMNNMQGQSESSVGSVGSVVTLRKYLQNPYQVAELLICVFIAGLGHFAPKHILRLELYERDIPYLQTAEGDIILDQYINRPIVDETVPDWALVLVSMIVPFFTIFCVGSYIGPNGNVHAGLCTLLFALGCNEFLTSFVKRYCGYFRPIFYNYCEFNENTMSCDNEDEDPRMSFPSGHSSLSFCGMTVLSLYFLGYVGLHLPIQSISNGSEYNGDSLQRERQIAKELLKRRTLAILSTFPLCVALFIASSRVHDDRHHPADIVGGSLIGLACAIFSHGLWYTSPYSGLPINTQHVFRITEESEAFAQENGA